MNTAAVWLVDLALDRVEVHRAPTGDGDTDHAIFARDAIVTALLIPDLELRVVQILG